MKLIGLPDFPQIRRLASARRRRAAPFAQAAVPPVRAVTVYRTMPPAGGAPAGMFPANLWSQP